MFVDNIFTHHHLGTSEDQAPIGYVPARPVRCRVFHEQHPTLSGGKQTPRTSNSGDNIPARADESPHNSIHIDNMRLWQLLDGGANTAFVGLKAPGRARGMWRAQRLFSRAEEEISRNAVISLPGVTLVRHLPPLPLVELRIADTMALRKLRQLPFVDYVEPAVIPKSVREEAIAKFASSQPSCRTAGCPRRTRRCWGRQDSQYTTERMFGRPTSSSSEVWVDAPRSGGRAAGLREIVPPLGA